MVQTTQHSNSGTFLSIIADLWLLHRLYKVHALRQSARRYFYDVTWANLIKKNYFTR